MRIRTVERKTELEAGGLVPPGLVKQNMTLLGCEEQGAYTGAAVLLKKGAGLELVWLYVKPEYRQKGVGTALLEGALRLAERTGAERIGIVYDAAGESSAVLDVMLARQGFLMGLERTIRVRVGRNALFQAKFMQEPEKELADGVEIVPLARISTLQLKNLAARCAERGYCLVSHADYSLADARRSMALVADGEIQGILLLRHEEDDGVISIPLLFMEKEYIPYALELLKKAAVSLKDPAANLKTLEFCCMEDSVLKLAMRLIEDAELRWDEVITGERWMA